MDKYHVVDTGAQNFDNIQPDPGGDDTVFDRESVAIIVVKICYASLPVAKKLQSETHLIGILNRKYLPADVTQARLKCGEVQAAENDDWIAVRKWKHKIIQ